MALSASLRSRAELPLERAVGIAVLVAMVGSIQLFPRDVPTPTYGFGLVSGAFLALNAVAVVLVYRAHRIINFAQVQIGLVAGMLFASLVTFAPLLRGMTKLCPGCRVTPLLVDVNYWVSLALGMVLAVLLSFATYVFVIKRFGQAPRLLVTVATVFLAQLLGGLQGLLPDLLKSGEQKRAQAPLARAELPLDFDFHWSGVRFVAPQILVVLAAIVAVVGVTAYFRITGSGTAIRASAENPERAETVGVNVSALNSRVWVATGVLSGLAGLFSAMLAAPSTAPSLNTGQILRVLAAAVVAGMVSLLLAGLAAVVIEMLFAAIVISYQTDVLLETVLFGVIVVLLLVQRRGRWSREREAPTAWRSTRELRPIPAELRSLPVVLGWKRAGTVLGGLAVLGLPFLLSTTQTSAATVVLLYGMVAMSLLVLTGWAGQISLGQFAFAAVGAYVVARWRLPFLVALPIGAFMGAVAAVVVALPALRLRGLQLAVATLGFALAVQQILLGPRYLGKHLPSTIDRPALLGIDLDDRRSMYYVVIFMMVLVVVALAGARRSQLGRVLIAGRDNERAVATFGVNLVRARLVAFVLSGAIAGLAGALYAFQQGSVTALDFDAGTSLLVFIIAVLGGLGSIAGPLIGTLYYGVLRVLDASPVTTFLATGGGGLLLLLMVPGGLAQLAYAIRDTLLRRLAMRRGIVVPSLLGDAGGSDGRRGPIAPKRRPGGGDAYIPPRYRLDGQWALDDGDGDGDIGDNGGRVEAEASRG